MLGSFTKESPYKYEVKQWFKPYIMYSFCFLKGLKCNIRTRSQLTCDEDTELVHGSPASPLDTLSRHSSGCDWSKGRTKTPDLLAEIMVK